MAPNELPGGTPLISDTIPTRSSLRAVPWRLNDVVIGFFPLLVLWALALTPAARTIPLWLAGVLGLLGIAWVAGYPLYTARRRGWTPQFSPKLFQTIVEVIAAVLTVTAFWVFLAVAFAVWVNLFGEPPPSVNPVEEAVRSPNPLWLVAVAVLVVVVAPLSEELFFRGMVYNALRRRLPIPVAILIQAVLFGLMHLPNGVSSAVVAGLVGIVLALAYDLRKTLLAPILCHTLHNAVVVGVALLTLGSAADAPMLGVHGTTAENGYLVTKVLPGSGAEEVGIRPGDVIVSVNGSNVWSVREVVTAIRGKGPDDIVAVEYLHEGQLRRDDVVLKRRGALIRE